MRPIFYGYLLSRSTEFIKVFYNNGTDVPDAGCVRQRLLLSAANARTLNHATAGGFYAVKTVHGIINVNREGE